MRLNCRTLLHVGLDRDKAERVPCVRTSDLSALLLASEAKTRERSNGIRPELGELIDKTVRPDSTDSGLSCLKRKVESDKSASYLRDLASLEYRKPIADGGLSLLVHLQSEAVPCIHTSATCNPQALTRRGWEKARVHSKRMCRYAIVSTSHDAVVP